MEKHEDAIAYDLIALGLRLRDLGTQDFTWGDLRAIVSQAPHFSALYRALYPEESQWGLQEQLMAAIVDYQAILAWQNGGGSKKDYPKPIPRPGIEDDSEQYGNDAIPMDEMAAWLGWD